MEYKFAYNSPEFLLNTSISLFKECIENENNLNAQKQCLFIINSAATVEAFLNWYYYFEKNIDVENHNGQRMSTKYKRLNVPLSDLSKREIKAIIDYRSQIMHPKYKPREVYNETPFSNVFMLYFLGSIIKIVKELIDSSENEFKNRIVLKDDYLKILNKSQEQKLIDENGIEVFWLDLIENNQVGLPIPSRVHIK